MYTKLCRSVYSHTFLTKENIKRVIFCPLLQTKTLNPSAVSMALFEDTNFFLENE